MPKEVFDPEEFLKISKRARECRVKRLGDVVKLKLRTSRQLYTLKIPPDKAEELLKKVRCKVVEL